MFALAVTAFAEPKPEAQVFKAEGTEFSLQVPEGWATNTQSGEKYGADVLVYQKTRTREVPDGVVRVRVLERRHDSAEKDFADYLQAYKAEYAGVLLKPFKASHPKYRVYAKKLVLPDGKDEYTAFVSPGRAEVIFHVGMTKRDGAAPSAEESAVFGKVLASLKLLKAVEPGEK